MALLKTAWANLQDGLGNRFSWSHVKAIFYNYAEQKLLSTKLDEMDALIDEKIAKAMMSNVQVNDQTKVPTSALAYSMNESITKLNSDSYKLSGGTEIPSNADLKSSQYLIPGNYYCPSNITANTLLNCPFKSAFILKVEISSGIGNQYIRQTFTQYDNSNVVSRVYLGDTSTWKDGINTNDFPYKVIQKSIEQSVVQPHGSITIANNLSEYGTYCGAFLCNTYGGPMIYQLIDGGINNHQISLINQADVEVNVGGTILYFIV